MDKYKARMQIEDTLDGVLFHDDVIDEIFDLVMGSGIERQKHESTHAFFL